MANFRSLCQHYLLVLSVGVCVVCFSVNLNVGFDYGPYDHVYPNTDITRNQLECLVSQNETCPLYIALMMSFAGEFDSSGVIPGIQLAIDQINDDPTILVGYSLHYLLKTTKVSGYS